MRMSVVESFKNFLNLNCPDSLQFKNYTIKKNLCSLKYLSFQKYINQPNNNRNKKIRRYNTGFFFDWFKYSFSSRLVAPEKIRLVSFGMV